MTIVFFYYYFNYLFFAFQRLQNANKWEQVLDRTIKKGQNERGRSRIFYSSNGCDRPPSPGVRIYFPTPVNHFEQCPVIRLVCLI